MENIFKTNLQFNFNKLQYIIHRKKTKKLEIAKVIVYLYFLFQYKRKRETSK